MLPRMKGVGVQADIELRLKWVARQRGGEVMGTRSLVPTAVP